MKEIYDAENDLFFLGLEEGEYERSEDWSKLKVKKDVIDAFIPLTILSFCFLDTGDKVAYQMIDKKKNWIYLERFC